MTNRSNRMVVEGHDDGLPHGSAPAPLAPLHFPSRLHAVVWRNWDLIAVDRLARVLGCSESQLIDLAASMGLAAANPHPPTERVYMTILRRNWHLLP